MDFFLLLLRRFFCGVRLRERDLYRDFLWLRDRFGECELDRERDDFDGERLAGGSSFDGRDGLFKDLLLDDSLSCDDCC